MVRNDHYALIVAIGRYEEYAPLRSPESDAVGVIEWLTTKGGVPECNIKFVRASGDGTPVNKDIKKALQALEVRAKQRHGARLYIYYAGHGLGPAFNEVALIPADATVDDCDDTFFGIALCFDFFVKTGFFDEVVAFLDCCREEVAVKAIGFPWPAVAFQGACANGVNLFAMMGSTHGGTSNELRTPPLNEVKYRGLMTRVLIDGLNGAPAAVDPATNTVTTESLLTYVRRRVEAEAKDRALPQRVDPYAHGGPAMPLFVLPTPAAPTVALSITVGPRTAGAPIHVQNVRTQAWTSLAAGAAGERLPAVPLAGDTLHQIVCPPLPPSDWPTVDPSKLSDRCDITLP